MSGYSCLAQCGCIQGCSGHIQGSPGWHWLAIHLKRALQGIKEPEGTITFKLGLPAVNIAGVVDIRQAAKAGNTGRAPINRLNTTQRGTDLFAKGVDPHGEQAGVQRLCALKDDHAVRAARQEAP